jgi:hypothetical protein
MHNATILGAVALSFTIMILWDGVSRARARRELQQELEREHARRVYYQDIVYSVCNSLDRIFGKRPGKGIVCGTADAPSDGVQRAMTEAEQRCYQWSASKAAQDPGDQPMMRNLQL